MTSLQKTTENETATICYIFGLEFICLYVMSNHMSVMSLFCFENRALEIHYNKGDQSL